MYLMLQQDTLPLSTHGLKTDVYWVCVSKRTTKFELVIADELKSLVKHIDDFKIRKPATKILAAINTCPFFNSDIGPSPWCFCYHACIRDGVLLQPPSNTRPLIVETMGRINLTSVGHAGTFYFDTGHQVDWDTSKVSPNEKATLHGIFDVKLAKDPKTLLTRPIDHSHTIKATANKILLGIRVVKGKTSVAAIDRKYLDLRDYNYVLRVEDCVENQVPLGAQIMSYTLVQPGPTPKQSNAISAMMELPRNRHDIALEAHRSLRPKKRGFYALLDKNYRKAWNIFMETNNSYIFLATDSVPESPTNPGCNIYELHDWLIKKLPFKKAVLLDGGQSTKLYVESGKAPKVYCNMHYMDYSFTPHRPNGLHGRSVPSVLIAYQEI